MQMHARAFAVPLVLAAASAPAVAAAQAAPAQAAPAARPVVSARGIVATESPAASRVGRAVLEGGGNAIDAAAATVFALGAARPQSCGIGGGGFAVLRTRAGAVRTIDFRETAPAAFRRDSLVAPGLHQQFTGHLTVGVPGVVDGLTGCCAATARGRCARRSRPPSAWRGAACASRRP
jgi:gamma-glutamyltranspeptidase/glutathione hydrolase